LLVHPIQVFHRLLRLLFVLEEKPSLDLYVLGGFKPKVQPLRFPFVS
jgi:hypothetical protein